MEDVTILSVFWNQQKAVELMLKTYVKYHYSNVPLKCLFVDNGSSDGTNEWLQNNGVPYINLPRNGGHSEILNVVWNKVNTKYLLLVDSDVEFRGNVFEYISPDYASVGAEVCNPPLHPRIGPWFWILDVQRLRDAGIHAFRGEGNSDCSYDTGSWLWEKVQQAGLTHHNLWMREWDKGLHFHEYEKVLHYSQVSAASPNLEARKRHAQIAQNVTLYNDIDLREKFVGENSVWTNEFLTKQLAKGWWPIYYDC